MQCPATIDRLEAILQAKGITVFARIDQQTEAEKVGLSLPPTQLLLFGNPKLARLLPGTKSSSGCEIDAVLHSATLFNLVKV
ncbi:DUF302 domain-containing protein [Nostoc sp.]|uniref:DUF302 domain-containing protein n=1 Tax=Nostoc sp. TaxID=1180 RepID=UPI002FF4A4E0